MAGLAGCSGSQQAERPNVVIIYADDLGYGDLSCNGATTVSTPNVDRIASQGIRFTNAHTTSSVSTPARYGLLTGQYPWRRKDTGIAAGNAGMIIRPEQYTMADMFKDEGYATGAIGKWHLGLGDKTGSQDWNGTISPALEDIGFDYSYIMAATSDRVPCVFIENGRVVNLDPSDPIEVSYTTPFEGEPTGKNNPEMLKMTPSHGHDQTIVNGVSRIGYMKGGKSALWRDEDIADIIAAQATGFIEQNKDKPFFLYVGTNDIHVPRVPHERFAGKSGMGPRGDAILSFDMTVGKIADKLEELGLADNTILIISSDNGPVVDDGYNDQAKELLGNHKPWGPFRGGKYSAFEAGTRTPMIICWGHRLHGESAQLVSHIDLFASLRDMIGAEIPEGAAPDSRSSLNAFMGKKKSSREYVIEQNLQWTLSILDSEGWKYIDSSNGPSYLKNTETELGNAVGGQLYNLNEDINEQSNLIDQYPDKAASLKALLDAEKSAPVPPQN